MDTLNKLFTKYKWGLRVVVFGQAAFMGAVGAAYYGLMYKQDARYWLRENYPSILRDFYRLAEGLDRNFEVRKLDELTWSTQSATVPPKKIRKKKAAAQKTFVAAETISSTSEKEKVQTPLPPSPSPVAAPDLASTAQT